MRNMTEQMVPGAGEERRMMPTPADEAERFREMGYPAECERVSAGALNGIQGARRKYYLCRPPDAPGSHEHATIRDANDCLGGSPEKRKSGGTARQ